MLIEIFCSKKISLSFPPRQAAISTPPPFSRIFPLETILFVNLTTQVPSIQCVLSIGRNEYSMIYLQYIDQYTSNLVFSYWKVHHWIFKFLYISFRKFINLKENRFIEIFFSRDIFKTGSQLAKEPENKSC